MSSEGPAASRCSWPLAAVTDAAPVEETVRACWEIRGYSRLEKKKDVAICSPPIVEACGARFYLKAYFRGHANSPDGKFGLRVGREHERDKDAQPVRCRIRVTVEGAGTAKLARRSPDDHYNTCLPCNSSSIGWNDFDKIEVLERPPFLVDDTLVIGLQVTAWVAPDHKKPARTWTLPAAPRKTGAAAAEDGADDGRKRKRARTQPTLAGDLAAFLSGGQATDVQVGSSLDGAEENAVGAHRVVLAARSPVFNRMLLESGMSEARAGAKICLEGVDHAIVKRFVDFLYTDELSQESLDCPDALCHLHALAHRYDVRALQELCVTRLAITIAEDNVVERLMLAEHFGIPTLKEQALGFLCSCRKRLRQAQKTEAFARMSKNQPQIVAELLVKATED